MADVFVSPVAYFACVSECAWSHAITDLCEGQYSEFSGGDEGGTGLVQHSGTARAA